MNLTSYLLGLGSALLIGFSKTGLPGVSIPGIVLMTEAFPDDAKLSLGAILPVLLVGDVFAVAWYRHHADWSQLLGLIPFVAAGMLPGIAVLWLLDGNQLRPVLGGLILSLLALEAYRRWRESRRPVVAAPLPLADPQVCTCRLCQLDDRTTARDASCCARGWSLPEPSGKEPSLFSPAWWFMAMIGGLAGFATMIANAAMPVMTIYFLSRGLLKREFIGTAAWFFFLINLSKLPICFGLNVITRRTMQFGLIVAPMTLLGAILGVYVLSRLPQRLFDALALTLAGAAAVRLIVSGG